MIQKVGNVWNLVRFGQEKCSKPEQDAMLAGAGDEDEFFKCFDDMAGKELLWQGVKETREKELTYLRELGENEKVDERAAVAKYNVTPVDTKWVDTDKAFEGEPMQLRSRVVAREFKSADRPDLYAGTPPLEALKAITSIAASHSPEFSLMHVDVSCAYFHAKAQEARAGEIGSRRLLREGSRKNRIVDEEHVRFQRCSKQLGTRLARASRTLEPRAWAQCKKSVSQQEEGFTHGDDFVVAGSKESLLELRKQLESVYPIKASIIGQVRQRASRH